MKKNYNEKDLKDIRYLECEVKHLKHNIKLTNFYLDNPSCISELKNINTYEELLDFYDELHERLKFIRKNLRIVRKELANYEY